MIAALAGCATIEDRTTGRSNLCEVHHVAMTKREVPWLHGAIPMSREEASQGKWRRRTLEYPHSGDGEPSGDIVMPGEADRALVFVCPACERARPMKKFQ